MANRFWVGADGNWSDTNKWSTTSGGAGGASVPGSADVAVFDANSNTGTTAFTATVDTAFTITTLNISSVDTVVTIASAGNLTCSTSTTHAGSTGTNGVKFSGNPSLGAVSITTGTFDINGQTITCTTFTSANNSGTRVVAFGTGGTVNVTGNNATVWSVTAAGTSSVTGTGTINFTYSGSTGTRTISNLPDTSTDIDYNITAGTDIVTLTTSLGVKTLNFTGFAGSWTNSALTIGGGLTVSTGMTVSAGTNAVTFAATSGTNDITSNGKTLDFPITINGAGGTFRLIDALTSGSTRTFTFTAGTLNLNNLTLTTGIFAPTGTSTRVLAFGTGNITLTNNNATIWSGATLTNFSYTGTPLVESTYSGSTGTRTINHGATAGGTESNAVSFSITAGTDSVATTAGSLIKNLVFTGFSGTLTNTVRTIYGNFTASATMTMTGGAAATTFAATSGTQQITHPIQFDFPITINAPGATVKLTGSGGLWIGVADTQTSSRTLTLTAGTLDMNGSSIGCQIFSSNNSNTRTLKFNNATNTDGYMSITGNGTTVWDVATATNLTMTVANNSNGKAQFTYSGGAGTRTINHGSTAGGSAANALNFSVSGFAATDSVAFSGHFGNVLFFTGGPATGTITNTTRTIYDNFSVSLFTYSSGTAVTTFAKSSGTQTIDFGASVDFPIVFDGAGTKKLISNLTNGLTRTTTLTAGTLDLDVYTLTTGLFASSNSNTRSITFGSSSQITVTNNNTVVWDMATLTNFSYTGTSLIVLSYSGGAGTRTISHGNTAGGTESTALSFTINAATDTISTTTGSVAKNVIYSGFTGAGAIFVGGTIYGNLTLNSGMSIAANATATTFGATSGTQQITTAGVSIDRPLTINAPGATVQLQDNLTMGATRTLTLTAGTLDLVTRTLSTGLFDSNNSNSRTLAFGTGGITLTTTTAAATAWSVATATNLSVTGTPAVTLNGNSTSYTFSHGSTAGGSESNSISVSNGATFAGTLTITAGSAIRNLTVNNTTFTLANTAFSIYGNFSVAGATPTFTAGTNAWTFAATSGTKTITNSSARTLDFPITFNGVGGTWQLTTNNLTVGSTRTVTLTNGALDLNNLTLSTGLFSSSNANTRSVAFGTTGQITVTGNAATVWDTGTLTNWTTTGTFRVVSNYAGSTGTRTFTLGALAVDFKAGAAVGGVSFGTTGTDSVSVTGTAIANLDTTSYAGTLSNAARTLTGSLTIGSATTVGAGAAVTTFAGTTGTQDITSNGKTLDFPITLDGVGGTFRILDALTVGATRTMTLTNGTFNANNFNVTAGLFASNNSNTRTITMGSGTWTLSGSGSVWDLATVTNLTFNKDTANITLSDTSTSARTFAGGGLTYNNLTIGGATGTSTLTISGSNTFGTMASSKTVAHTITFTAGTTTTVADWTITGTAGNIVTLQSSTTATYYLTKTGGGRIIMGYMSISYASASPANTWYSPNSTDGGNNTGINFAGLVYYWIGGSGTWNNTNVSNWSLTSGGSATDTYPTSGAQVYFDANSDAGTGFTVTLGADVACQDLTISGLDQTMTLAGTNTVTLDGSVSLPSSNLTVTTTGTWTFNAATGTQTITTNGTALTFGITKVNAGTLQLVGNLTTGSARTVTLTQGTLDLNNNTLSSGLFSSSNSNTRSIGFGTTGQITLTGNAATVLDVATATNFSYTGTSNLVFSYAGSTGTRTINFGSTAGATESNVVNMTISGGSDTITGTGSSVKNFTYTGFTGTGMLFSNGTIYGNLTLNSGMTIAANASATTFGATTGTQTITTAGVSIDRPLTKAGAGTLQLIDALTTGSTRTFTLTAGTLDLNNQTLSTGLLSLTGATTRSIGFGTGQITLTGNAGTILDGATATNFTFTGTSNIVANYSGATGTRTLQFGSTAGGTEANSLTVSITAGTDSVATTAASIFRNLSFTGFAGTLTNTARTLYGSLTVSTGMTLTAGANATTFAAATGTQDITSNAKTLDFPLTFQGAGTRRLLDNLTVGSARTTTLTAGTLNLNDLTLSTGIFAPTGTTTRVLAFGTGQITLTGNAATIWSGATLTNFSYTGTPTVVSNYSGATGTRTIAHGTTGGTEANAVSFAITAGTDTVATTATSFIDNLVFTGFAGTLTNTARNIYGNLTLSTGMTLTAGTALTTFGATSGTQTITSAGRTMDFPVTFNGVGGTFALGDAITLGTTRTMTLTAGIFDASNFNVTAGLFAGTGTGTRTLTMGSGTWTLTGVGSVWNLTTTTNLTFNKNTANITLSDTSTSARTFAGGDLTYNDLTIGGATGTSTLTFTGSNTFAVLASTKTVAHTITFTAGTTTTMTTWNIRGSLGNIVTIGSSTTSAYTLAKSGGGKVLMSYVSISYATGSTANTWYAPVSTDGGNNTDITFTGFAFYWIGGSGTWDNSNTANWSDSSGGSSVSAFPVAGCDVNFDGSSDDGSNPFTVTISGSVSCSALTIGSLDQAMTLAGTGTLGVGGNVSLPSSNLTITATGTWTVDVPAATTYTWTSNGTALTFGITKTSAGTLQLVDNLTTGVTRAFTLTTGTLDLNDRTMSIGLLSSNNSNTRSIAFGTGQITVTGNAATVLDVATATNFSYTGTSNLVFSYAGSTGTRTINFGSTAGGTESNAVSMTISGGSDTLTGTGGVVKNFTYTGFTGSGMLFGLGTIYGNLTLNSGMTIPASTNATTFGATSGTQTINSAGVTIDRPITVNAPGATVQLLTNNLTIGSTRTFTLTAGTLDLNDLTLSSGLFSSSNTNTRSIDFGTGKITVTGGNATVWNMATLTNATFAGTPTVDGAHVGATGTRVFSHGNTAGGSASMAINLAISAGSDTITTTATSYIMDYDFTGFSGIFANTAVNIYGDLTISSGMTVSSGTGLVTFGASTGTQTITSAGKTFDFPVTFSGDGERQLSGNLTVGSTRTTTLTAGTLTMTDLTLSTGFFNFNNSNTRSIAFGTTGQITVTGNAGTVWDGATLTNFSYTGTFPTITCNYSGATGTRTISHGSTAGGSESTAVSFAITAGTDTVATTATSSILNLVFTGFSGTLTNTARNIYGNFTASTGMTLTAGANLTTLGATSGTQTITSAGRTFDFPMTLDGVGGTVALADALTMGSTRALTLTNGTFNASNFNVTAGLFSSNNSNTRTITMGSGTWTLASSGTVWDLADTTNLTFNKNSANIVLTNTTTSARTFAGGDLTYNDLTIGGATGVSTLTVTGSNTFGTVASTKTVAHTITLTSGTTTTVSNWTVKGRYNGLVTLNASSSGSAATLTKSGGGVIRTDWISLQDSAATPADTWFAGGDSVDVSGNTGWTFHRPSQMMTFFFT